MLNVMVAFDGQHFSEGAMKMVNYLNSKIPMSITGVFISPVDYRELLGYSGMGMGTPIFTIPVGDDEKMLEQTAKKFREYCRKNKLPYHTHKDTNLFAMEELIRETRFADLLIISSELFYENIDHDQPNEYLRRTLHESECPVLLVPENFLEPYSVLLSYDGKASSVFAIKQFAYLLGDKLALNALLFHGADEELPEKKRINELSSRHFNPLSIEHLNHDDAEQLKKWLTKNKHAILVAGAYGRGELSTIFRKSYISDLIRAHKIPIFIAHR
ncbi:MAG: hypothetical protein ACK45S_10445 [Sphingobacteriales bacterium]|jgi:hypothetical protein